MSTSCSAKILIVDDETAPLRALCDTLRDRGYDVSGFSNAEDALAALRGTSFDILLSDLMMPGTDGVDLLQEALAIDPQLATILMTGQGTIETAVKAMQAGALDYVLKPIRLNTLIPAIARAMGIRQLRLENLQLRNSVAIHELNQAFAATLDETSLLEKIADTVLEQFEDSEVSIMLLSDDGEELRVAVVRGEATDTSVGARIRVGEGIAGWVAAHREFRAVDSADDAAETPDSVVYPMLSMPMMARGTLIGVANVKSARGSRTFSQGQIEALRLFIGAAATGIVASRLHEEQRRAHARYRDVLDMAPDGVVSIDHDQCIVIFNKGAEEIFGYRAEEVLGKPLAMLLPEKLHELHRQHVQSFSRESDRKRIMSVRNRRLEGRRSDGTLFPVEVAISKRLEGGEPLYTAVVRDVTQRALQERRIARLSRIRMVLGGINSAIARRRDRDDLCHEACRIAVQDGQFKMAWIGFAEPDLGKVRPVSCMGEDNGYLEEVGKALQDIETDRGAGGRALRERHPIVCNDVAQEPAEFKQAALARGYRSFAVLPLLVRDEPRGVIALYAGEPGAFDAEEMELLKELADDVSLALEVMEQDDRLLYLTRHEVLSGLPNRAAFSEQLAQRVRIAREEHRNFGVILFDLERFRNINETLGRHAGDMLLRELAQRLRDTIGEGELLGHFGGDHFAVSTKHVVEGTDVGRTVEHILAAAFGTSFKVDGSTLRFAARAGVALHPTDGENAEKLILNAEAALREAKRAGQTYQFYAPSMNASIAQTLRLESRMRGALEREEFVLHYQPKVDLNTGDVTGLEALIRWNDSETGLVPPSQFVPLLEETGMIIEVGRWAMTEAVRMAATLNDGGDRLVRIAVNVSAIQLREEQFVRSVEQAISAAGGASHGLDLEITESTVMHDIEENVRTLDALREMGVELAIDDFGTGYSSLAYIGRLPVSVVKIDRSFIGNVGHAAGNRAIVETIISLTHALGRKVVAEGVETEEQAHLLKQLRCDQYQGFLFSKPLPAAEITQLLAAERGDSKTAAKRA